MFYLYILDLVGTFAFAVYGAYVGQKKGFDLFGIFVCAALTAIGGGTIRELMLGNTPFYFYDNAYIAAISIGVLFSIFVFHHFSKIKKVMLGVDAIGLATFALIGASKADAAGLGLTAMVFLAVINAAGGSLVRDIAIREVPSYFYTNFYAIPAALLGLAYGLFPAWQNTLIFAYALIIITFAMRIVAIVTGLQLWRPRKLSMAIEPVKETAAS